jgi:hypothetical protein
MLPEVVAALALMLVAAGVRALWSAGASRVLGRRPSGRRSPEDPIVNTERVRARLIASCVLIALVGVPLILGIVPPNPMYGFRVPATQADRAIWYPANAFMGWAILWAAFASAIVIAVVPPTAKPWVLWATYFVALGGAIVASFEYLRRLTAG